MGVAMLLMPAHVPWTDRLTPRGHPPHSSLENCPQPDSTCRLQTPTLSPPDTVAQPAGGRIQCLCDGQGFPSGIKLHLVPSWRQVLLDFSLFLPLV